jgi:hypothetical protein
MKKTDFTFFRTSMTGLLSAILPVLFFMTLSLGAEAQASIQDAAVAQTGVNVVNHNVAKSRLDSHVASLEAINPSTLQEEVAQSQRLDYAYYIGKFDASKGSFSYYVANSQSYLENRVTDFAPQYRLSAQQLYNEMLGLLR